MDGEKARNRRGCYLIAGVVWLSVVVVAALGLGLLGDVEGGKITDLPILDNRS